MGLISSTRRPAKSKSITACAFCFSRPGSIVSIMTAETNRERLYSTRLAHYKAPKEILISLGFFIKTETSKLRSVSLTPRYMLQDVFSKLQINIEKATIEPGFYHNKHYVIVSGRMDKNKFVVDMMRQPITCDSYKIHLSSKVIDYSGYKSKYLGLLSDVSLNQQDSHLENLR